MQWRQRVGTGFFLFVGAPRYYKGLPYLIEGARIARVQLVLAGVSAEQMRPASENIKVLGHITEEDKAALFALARAVVLPSHLRSEAYGLVLLEAARAGRPMICCELGTGTTYVNVAGETGLVVEPANALALAGAMRALAGDDALAARLGRAAQTRFDQFFGADVMGRSYDEIYRSVLRAGRKAGLSAARTVS
jgi:rhamnosyl/mannosyltransferase